MNGMHHGGQPVFIGGAGPAGLILANELLRRGIPVRQVEKRDGPSHTTKAFTLHARSMEMFEHMGVAPRLEEICLVCPGNVFHFQGMPDEQKPRLDFRTLPSRFAFYYKLNQNDFEQVLREHLFATYSHVPEYETEVVDTKSTASSARVTLKHRDTGELEEAEYPWIVGCDGAHSAVRERAGIRMHGHQVGVMAMMDVEITGFPYDDSWVNYFIAKDYFMLVTKLPGCFWRLYLSDVGAMTNADDPRASFQDAADSLDLPITVGEPHWATQWIIRNTMAESYKLGHVLICGDASHTHSPAGGQGMNGCMQDAFNLGWKLASVICGDSPEGILDTYEEERKPIGEQITLGAKATHDVAMAFDQNLEDRIQLTQTAEWHDNAVRLISGLSHNYHDVMRLPEGLQLVSGPQPGDRAPDALLCREPKRRVFDLYRHPGFTLLLVPGKDAEKDREIARVLVRQLDELYPGKIVARMISPQPVQGFDMDHYSADETGDLAKAYSFGDDGRIVLVRPDMYVGLHCVMDDWREVARYLESMLTGNRVNSAVVATSDANI